MSRAPHDSRKVSFARTIAALCWAGSPKLAPIGVTV
jgi:hypothetical protein